MDTNTPTTAVARREGQLVANHRLHYWITAGYQIQYMPPPTISPLYCFGCGDITIAVTDSKRRWMARYCPECKVVYADNNIKTI
jgi:hypothetical protein